MSANRQRNLVSRSWRVLACLLVAMMAGLSLQSAVILVPFPVESARASVKQDGVTVRVPKAGCTREWESDTPITAVGLWRSIHVLCGDRAQVDLGGTGSDTNLSRAVVRDRYGWPFVFAETSYSVTVAGHLVFAIWPQNFEMLDGRSWIAFGSMYPNLVMGSMFVLPESVRSLQLCVNALICAVIAWLLMSFVVWGALSGLVVCRAVRGNCLRCGTITNLVPTSDGRVCSECGNHPKNGFIVILGLVVRAIIPSSAKLLFLLSGAFLLPLLCLALGLGEVPHVIPKKGVSEAIVQRHLSLYLASDLIADVDGDRVVAVVPAPITTLAEAKRHLDVRNGGNTIWIARCPETLSDLLTVIPDPAAPDDLNLVWQLLAVAVLVGEVEAVDRIAQFLNARGISVDALLEFADYIAPQLVFHIDVRQVSAELIAERSNPTWHQLLQELSLREWAHFTVLPESYYLTGWWGVYGQNLDCRCVLEF